MNLLDEKDLDEVVVRYNRAMADIVRMLTDSDLPIVERNVQAMHLAREALGMR